MRSPTHVPSIVAHYCTHQRSAVAGRRRGRTFSTNEGARSDVFARAPKDVRSRTLPSDVSPVAPLPVRRLFHGGWVRARTGSSSGHPNGARHHEPHVHRPAARTL